MRNKEIAAASVYARSMYGDARLVSAFVCGCAFEMGREAARKRRRLVGDGWITINGTHVETKGGRLMGPVGRKIESAKPVQAAGSVEADRGTGEAANHVSQQAQTTAQVGVREALGDESYRAVQKVLEGSAPGIKSVWGALESRLKFAETNFPEDQTAYTDSNGWIHFNAKKAARGDLFNDPYTTLFHEGAHSIDRLLAPAGRRHFSAAYHDGELARTAIREARRWRKRYESRVCTALVKGAKALRKGKPAPLALGLAKRELMKLRGAEDYLKKKAEVVGNEVKRLGDVDPRDTQTFRKMLKELKRSIGREILSKKLANGGKLRMASVSDIFDGVSRGGIHGQARHGEYYWAKNVDGTDKDAKEIRELLGAEVFASLFSAHTLNGQDLSGLKEWLPKTCALFNKMMSDVRDAAEKHDDRRLGLGRRQR